MITKSPEPKNPPALKTVSQTPDSAVGLPVPADLSESGKEYYVALCNDIEALSGLSDADLGLIESATRSFEDARASARLAKKALEDGDSATYAKLTGLSLRARGALSGALHALGLDPLTRKTKTTRSLQAKSPNALDNTWREILD